MEFHAAIIKTIDEIQLGDVAFYARTVNEANIMMFAQLTGDYAPHHVSKVFGDSTLFKSRIAHGMITVGLIGPVLYKLCGDASMTKYQNIRFRSAVIMGETVDIRGEVVDIDRENELVTIDVVCEKHGRKENERPYITAVFKQSLKL